MAWPLKVGSLPLKSGMAIEGRVVLLKSDMAIEGRVLAYQEWHGR